MKTRKFIGMALAVAFAGSAGSVGAADTYSLGVTATVQAICKFYTAAGQTMSLTNAVGGIDPSVANDATGSVALTYRCTNGYTPSFSNGQGLYLNGALRLNDGGTNHMVYTLGFSAAVPGTGLGAIAANDKSLTVTGTIAQAQFVNAPAGTYSDTVVINIDN